MSIYSCNVNCRTSIVGWNIQPAYCSNSYSVNYYKDFYSACWLFSSLEFYFARLISVREKWGWNILSETPTILHDEPVTLQKYFRMYYS